MADQEQKNTHEKEKKGEENNPPRKVRIFTTINPFYGTRHWVLDFGDGYNEYFKNVKSLEDRFESLKTEFGHKLEITHDER